MHEVDLVAVRILDECDYSRPVFHGPGLPRDLAAAVFHLFVRVLYRHSNMPKPIAEVIGLGALLCVTSRTAVFDSSSWPTKTLVKRPLG